jgi:hypothetical protein
MYMASGRKDARIGHFSRASTVAPTVAAHCKANQHCAEGLGTDPAKVIFYKKFAFLSD